MYKEIINELELLIAEIEEKMEDDDFTSSDEFSEKYEKLKEKQERLDTLMESLPYGTASEKQIEVFDSLQAKMKKCNNRIRRIGKDSEINDADDSSWMFDEE